MARRPNEDVTDTELAILQVLWERGQSTRRQIMDALYPGGVRRITRLYKTARSVERKRLSARAWRGRIVIHGTVNRDELIRRRLRGLADKLCGGAVTPLVMNLVRSGPLSDADASSCTPSS